MRNVHLDLSSFAPSGALSQQGLITTPPKKKKIPNGNSMPSFRLIYGGSSQRKFQNPDIKGFCEEKKYFIVFQWG